MLLKETKNYQYISGLLQINTFIHYELILLLIRFSIFAIKIQITIFISLTVISFFIKNVLTQQFNRCVKIVVRKLIKLIYERNKIIYKMQNITGTQLLLEI